jgi:hypothetical protein
MGLYEIHKEERDVEHVKNLRLFLCCWCVFERYGRVNKKPPDNAAQKEEELFLRCFDIKMLA